MKLKKEKIINIIMDIFIVLFLIMLIISLYNVFELKVKNKSYSSIFGYSSFEVQTGSMAKTINIGDWIIVKKTDEIKLNDIVTYEQKGNFITHRVVEVYKNTIVTKGDNNNTKDKVINKNQVVGTVVKILPHFGILKKTIFNPAVLVLIIATLYIFLSIFKEKEKNEKINDIKLKIKNLFKKNKVIEVKEKIKVNEIENIKEDITVKKSLYDDIDTTEDLSKTIIFRSIKADVSDVEAGYELKKEVEEEQEEISEVKKEDNTNYEEIANEKIELFKKKRNNKYKNIIDKIMSLKKEEINEIIEEINISNKVLVNEKTIKSDFIDAYIDARYYNYCGNINVKFTSKTCVSKISKVMKDFKKDLLNNFSGIDLKYEAKLDKYLNYILFIVNLESANNYIIDIKSKRKIYKDLILEYFEDESLIDIGVINTIIDIQRTYEKAYEIILDKLKSNKFILNYSQLLFKKNVYALRLDCNIKFSDMYSSYIIDKTEKDDSIREDEVIVMTSILMGKLTEDMFSMNFNKKYIMPIVDSLFDKQTKLQKVFNLLDDELAKNNTILLISYDTFINNYKLIKDQVKDGYKFSIYFDYDSSIKAKDIKYLSILTYIFISKMQPNFDKINDSIKDIYEDIIIYEKIAEKFDLNIKSNKEGE